jgi:general secretion pathway protein N
MRLLPKRTALSMAHRPGKLASTWGLSIACAMLGVLLAVLTLFPAQWALSSLERSSQGQVQFVDARGTVWSGSAVVLLTGGTGSTALARLPDRVQWRLRPSFNGIAPAVGLQVTALCCGKQPVQAKAWPMWAGFGANVAVPDLVLPANLLAGLGTPWNTLALQGLLRLSSPGMSIKSQEGRMLIEGQAVLDVQSASSRLSTLNPLGDYRIRLVGAAAGGSSPLSVQLETTRGALQVSGSGQWVGNRLRFSGRASAEPQHQEALQNILNIVGRREGTSSIITIG